MAGPRDGRTRPELDPAEFRELGHRLVDDLAELLERLRSPSALPVTTGETTPEIQAVLGADAALPEDGAAAGDLLHEATELLFEHSLLTGHPRFLAYVIGAPSPLAA